MVYWRSCCKEKSYRFLTQDYTYTVNAGREVKVDSEEIGRLATELHDAGIGPLRDAFAAVGMHLLTPAQYLDAPDKQAAYENARIEAGGRLRGLRHRGWRARYVSPSP